MPKAVLEIQEFTKTLQQRRENIKNTNERARRSEKLILWTIA